MKNIEWLNTQMNRPIMGTKEFELGYSKAVGKFNRLLDQLDEPEVLFEEWQNGYDQGRVDGVADLESDEKMIVTKVPTIPQFVADWIEEAKYSKLTLFGAMKESPREVEYWFIESDKTNQDLFARAWLYGYTVEEEPKYYVVKSKGLDGAHYYFRRFNGEMEGLFTFHIKQAFRFNDKEKAQTIADFTGSTVEELEE